MKKRCQIYAGLPITCFEVPIIGHAELNLTPDEIYKCLCAKAEVIEILPTGKRINLDFSNYDKDNYFYEVQNIIKSANDLNIEEPHKAVPLGPFMGEPPEAVPLGPFIGETPEPIPCAIADEIDTKEETEEILKVEDKTEVIEEAVNTEESETVEETEAPVAETVKSYQVASRNNNVKKAKNKK